ncbi:RCC1/BLIP-II [Auricularia subglabra TFB-10046 SS5]|nr:RCC1/BLIP-II [Auricularia subglabra TFB-10046 SS5]
MVLKLLSSGSNAHGQLAHGTVDDVHTFTPCLFASPPPSDAAVIDIACGANHTLLLLRSPVQLKSTVWVVGDGSHGQLGPISAAITFEPLCLPIPLDTLEPVAIAASWESSYVVLRGPDCDILLSFGSNVLGELGRGTETTQVMQPVDLSGALNGGTFRIAALSSGPRHVLCLVECGSGRDGQQCLIGWGASRHGQLGTRETVVPNPITVPNPFQEENSIVSVACGNQHTLLLSAVGTVHGLGSNRKGQLSDAISRVSGIQEIACAWNTSFLVASDVIHGFGSGDHGQLGREDDITTGQHTIALGRVAQAIAAGSEHALVLTQDRSIYGWGWNEHGNLGLNHTQDVFAPVVLPATRLSQAEGACTKIWGGCGTSWISIS